MLWFWCSLVVFFLCVRVASIEVVAWNISHRPLSPFSALSCAAASIYLQPWTCMVCCCPYLLLQISFPDSVLSLLWSSSSSVAMWQCCHRTFLQCFGPIQVHFLCRVWFSTLAPVLFFFVTHCRDGVLLTNCNLMSWVLFVNIILLILFLGTAFLSQYYYPVEWTIVQVICL